MASPLEVVSIVAPGFGGLNLQESPATIDKSYGTVLHNVVIDSSGRIAARKGWNRIHGPIVDLPTTKPVEVVHEWVDSAGTREILFVGNDRIWTIYGLAPLEIYAAGDWTDNKWQCANLNGSTWFFQKNHKPLYYNGTKIDYVANHSGYSATVPQGNAVLSGWGRLWVADTATDRTTVYWSDSLQGEDWGSGTAGSLNLQTVMSRGISPIVALAEFNDFLVILCRNQIILYTGTSVPANMSIQDVITGVGCIARDSVVNIGTDILFLSDTGVRSLGRIIQEKSNPMYDVSYYVRDSLVSNIYDPELRDVKAAYNDKDGYVLYSFPNKGISYCFDLRLRAESGAARATTWSIAPHALYMSDEDFYMGFEGFLGKSIGYADDGAPYSFTYRSPFLNNLKDEQSSSQLTIPKAMRVSAFGGYGYTLRAAWGFDYDGLSFQQNYTLPDEVTPSEYDNNESTDAEYFYGAEYGRNYRYPVHFANYELRGDGRNIQVQITAQIHHHPLALQQIDIFYKRGKIDHV